MRRFESLLWGQAVMLLAASIRSCANLGDGAKSLELTEAIYQSGNADGQQVAVPIR